MLLIDSYNPSKTILYESYKLYEWIKRTECKTINQINTEYKKLSIERLDQCLMLLFVLGKIDIIDGEVQSENKTN